MIVKGVVDRVAKTLLLALARVWSHREGELFLPSVVLGDPQLQGPWLWCSWYCQPPAQLPRVQDLSCRADPHKLGRDTCGHGHPAAWPAVQGWKLPPDSAARSESENPAAGSPAHPSQTRSSPARVPCVTPRARVTEKPPLLQLVAAGRPVYLPSCDTASMDTLWLEDIRKEHPRLLPVLASGILADDVTNTQTFHRENTRGTAVPPPRGLKLPFSHQPRTGVHTCAVIMSADS